MPKLNGVSEQRKLTARYVGVDASLNATAMVSLDFFGNITHVTRNLGYPLTEDATTWEQTQRALTIASGVVPFVANCRYAAIEGYAYSAKGARVYQIAELGGIIRSRLMDYPDSYPHIIPPTSLKKFATGKGRCKKAQVIIGVFKKWGFEADDDDDNVVDAYVLAQMMRYHHIVGIHTGAARDTVLGWHKKHEEEVKKVMDSLTKYQRETLMACKLY